mgnify:CR=1 FL=1|jgi:hypothetical protein
MNAYINLKFPFISLSISLGFLTSGLMIYLNPIQNKFPSYISFILSVIFLLFSGYYFLNYYKKFKITNWSKITDLLGICAITFILAIYLFYLVLYLITGIF